MDLEVENNNMICAVKEIYSRFVNDTYIAQRIKVCKATLLGDLVVEVANIVEKQIDQARKAKKEMVGEIQAKFLEVSDKIDKQVKKMFKDADEKHNNFVENRAKNYVFEYNRLAEEDRLAKCDIRKKKLFHKVYLELKPLTGHPSEIGSKSSHSSSSGNPVPIQFKSNTTFTTSVNNPNNDSSKKDANKSEKTVNDTNPIKPAQVDQTITQPEVTDDEFKKICDSTKLSEPEVVEIEGLSGFSYVRQLTPLPSPGHFFFSADQSTGTVKRLQSGRLKASIKKRSDNCRVG